MRGGGLLALRAAAGLDDDDRLVARRRARGRHELPRLVDRFDAQQDGARVGVAAQVVEHVAKVAIGVLAQRAAVRKADLPRLGPVQHGGDQRARLRDKRQLARPRRNVRKARVQPRAGAEQPDAVGPQDAQQRRPRGVQHGLLLLGREAGADHDGGPRAALGQLPHQVDHRGGGRADDGQLGHLGQVGHAGVTALAGQLAVLRVDGEDAAGKAAAAHVAPQRAADRKRPLRRADDGDRLRIEQ